MTSIGRGRGWARPLDRETTLRRPGQPSSPKSPDVEELINRIHNVVRLDEQWSAEEGRTLSTYAASVADSHTNLREKLWKQMIEDRCFGIKFMRLYHPHNRKKLTEGCNLLGTQTEILRRMQDSYENREELRKENPLHVANLTWILGAMKGTSGHECLARHLGVALIKLFEMLLETATEDDVETVAIQLYVHGKAIMATLSDDNSENSTESVGFDDLMTNVRTILINRNVSARTRALLLFIIDFANNRFEPLTGDLQSYYASIFAGNRKPEVDSKNCNSREFDAETYLNAMLTKGMKPENRIDNSLVTKVTPKTTMTTPVPTPTSMPTQTSMPTPMPTPMPLQPPPQTQVPIQMTREITKNELSLKQTQKINRGPSGVGPGPFPRAIRGSGASDSFKDQKNDKKSSKGHKDKLTDEQVWSAKQNTGSKVWGHDDRFDNDYE